MHFSSSRLRVLELLFSSFSSHHGWYELSRLMPSSIRLSWDTLQSMRCGLSSGFFSCISSHRSIHMRSSLAVNRSEWCISMLSLRSLISSEISYLSQCIHSLDPLGWRSWHRCCCSCWRGGWWEKNEVKKKVYRNFKHLIIRLERGYWVNILS